MVTSHENIFRWSGWSMFRQCVVVKTPRNRFCDLACVIGEWGWPGFSCIDSLWDQRNTYSPPCIRIILQIPCIMVRNQHTVQVDAKFASFDNKYRWSIMPFSYPCLTAFQKRCWNRDQVHRVQHFKTIQAAFATSYLDHHVLDSSLGCILNPR